MPHIDHLYCLNINLPVYIPSGWEEPKQMLCLNVLVSGDLVVCMYCRRKDSYGGDTHGVECKVDAIEPSTYSFTPYGGVWWFALILCNTFLVKLSIYERLPTHETTHL